MKQGKNGCRYTTLENAAYLMGGALKWRPVYLLCLAVLAVTEGLGGFVWLVAGRNMIRIFENPELYTADMHSVVRIVLTAACFQVIFLLGTAVATTTASGRITDIRCRFVLMTNYKMMTMPYDMLEKPSVQDAKRKSDQAAADMVNGVEGMLRQCAHLPGRMVTMAAAAVILLRLSPALVVLIFLLSCVRGSVGEKESAWEKEQVFDPMIPDWRRRYYYLMTAGNKEYAKDIRIFQMKDAILQKLDEVYGRIQAGFERKHDHGRNSLLQAEAVGFLQEAAMYVWLVGSVLFRGMSVADFTLYAGSIHAFTQAVEGVLGIIRHLRADSRLVNDYRNLLDEPEHGGEAVKSSFKKDAGKYAAGRRHSGMPVPRPKDGKYEFRFENVSFSYPESGKYALKNIDLTIRAGERLAVVGMNGAGKSTFIKLLCRLYEPVEGVIYLNGTDITAYDREDYFRLIAPVFQNVECFAFPLAENVSMCTPEETDRDKAAECLVKAGLGGKLEELPQGVDTQLLRFLYPDGTELSGGEKQKMALARALYQDAPVVVLDEPTAALDALAEYQTYLDFDRLIGAKTAVYISHRLSSTRFCHRIALFENGRIVEYGTHEQLLQAGGAYARMFEVQAQYYRDGEVAAHV